jgi:xanthine dehydrogenase molybdopterin-binding subunit B
MKSGHVVKMAYDRMEDLAATTKRHPSRVRHRTALGRDGKLLAMDIEVATEGGAYSTLSSTVLSRATLHSPGPYVCPNVRVKLEGHGRSNAVPYGAFRGFGAPQAIFRCRAAHGRDCRGDRHGSRWSFGGGTFYTTGTRRRRSR